MDKQNTYIRILWLFTLMLILKPLIGQDNSQLLSDIFRENKSASYPERIHVHMDRNYYLTGERIWFSVYCLEQDSFKPSVASSVAYIELLNHQGQVILQKKIELKEGKGKGCLDIPLTCNSEEYVLRCYTSWQRNFGVSHFFYNNILIINPSRSFSEVKSIKPLDGFRMKFFPEGGQLAQGVSNHIVFTITDENNDPVNCTGEVFSDDTVKLATISTLQPGIGAFTLAPEKGREYHIRYFGAGNYLPEEIQIENPADNACALKLISLPSQLRKVILRPDQSIIDSNQIITALVWTGSAIKMIETLKVDSVVQFYLREDITSPGINHLAVFDEQNHLLAERMFYVQDGSSITIEAQGLKDSYRPRETIEFALETSGFSGIPISSTSSVSVTISGSHALHAYSNSLTASMLLGNQVPQLFQHQTDAISDTLMDLYMIANSEGSCSWINNPHVNIEYIPEMEGLMVSGTIEHNNTREAVAHQKMMLSFIDTLPDYYTTTSNEKGRFHFSLDHMTGRRDIIVQAFNLDNGFIITLDDEFSSDPLPEYKFPSLNHGKLSELYETLLLNQQLSEAYSLKSAYNSSKEDRELPFYGRPDQEILIEDFIKLPLMEEVFRELARRVYLTKTGSSHKVSILDLKTNRIIGNDPMFFLDGIPFFSSEKLLSLDPLKLRSIKFKSERYFLNEISMDGIIDIRSLEGEAGLVEFPRSAVRKYFQAIPGEKLTFLPASTDQKDERVPIFQSTLFFDHLVTTSPGKKRMISFIAPDQKGEYDVIIKVLGENGRITEKHLSFTVD